MPGGVSDLTFWTGPFPTEEVFVYLFLLPCFIEIPVLNANSVETDQTSFLRRLIRVYTFC